jgi:hypothetical protein
MSIGLTSAPPCFCPTVSFEQLLDISLLLLVLVKDKIRYLSHEPRAGRYMTKELVSNPQVMLPPILAGQFTPETQKRVERFYFSVAAIFETWVKRRQSRHTRRAYREDVMAFIKFMGITWRAVDGSRISTVSRTPSARLLN